MPAARCVSRWSVPAHAPLRYVWLTSLPDSTPGAVFWPARSLDTPLTAACTLKVSEQNNPTERANNDYCNRSEEEDTSAGGGE